MTEKKGMFHNKLISNSTKSQTKEKNAEFNNVVILDEPNKFEIISKKDKTEENQNESISNLNIGNELQNKIRNTKIKQESENRKTRPKYFEDINSSSIVKKEESISEFNTNKKSQGSDFALFKMINEFGNNNKNSASKFKVTESLENYDPINSITIRNSNINSKNIKVEKEDSKNEIFKIEEENIKTNEYVKSENSDFIQNEKDDQDKTDINRMNIKLLFKPNEEDTSQYIKETKNQIINDINNIYENNQLNLVKINNHEIYNFITEYNHKSKDDLDYEPDYYKLSDKNDKFILRRNYFLSHNYFSYIINEKDKEKYLYEKIKKHKINYNEKIDELNFVINSNILSSRLKDNKAKKEPKVYDIENISSFFYNFCLYYPNNDNMSNNNKIQKIILDEKAEDELIKTIIAYRKIYNDGHSFQRCFSFLLIETFLLKNKLNELNYIIYDIKKTLKHKYLNIDQTLNILFQIKEASSIEYLMETYNNSEIKLDEIMITYIEDKINIINNIDTINKRKYQEINYIYFKTLCDIFDINIKILSIEENKSKNKLNNNSLLSLNTLDIFCESFNTNMKDNKNSQLSESSNSSELSQNYPTFYILFFINSYHIIYTNKSDVDSTMANNGLISQHYFLPSLPNLKCPKCNKNNPLDIIPYYETVLCHKCLIFYMKDIIKNRVVLFIKSGFSSVEYFTRPISIKQDVKINMTLYKYITRNYFMKDFENIFHNTCFICYKYFNNNKKKAEKNNKLINNINNNIIKIFVLKCKCQICENCLEEKKREFMGEFNYLNLHEIHNLKLSKCPCGNIYDINEIINYSKIKFTENDKNLALQRLKLILSKKCCICLNNKEEINNDFINLFLVNSPKHFICKNCFQAKIKENNGINKTKNKKIEMKYENEEDKKKNKIYFNDLESSDSSLKDCGTKDQKFFCNICFTEHILDKNEENKKIIDKKQNKKDKAMNKCCGKCVII